MTLVEWATGRAVGAPQLARRVIPSTRTTQLVGDLRTGRISTTVEAAGFSWAELLNSPGSVDQVAVPERVVRSRALRQNAAKARCFLAVEQDGRVREAGPIWAHRWDDKRGVLTLGAAGLWSLFDHRYVLPVLAAADNVAKVSTTLSGMSLGGIARGLVQQAMTHLGGELPIVFDPADTTGDHEETFPGYKLLTVGQQIRELTAREVGAPDVRFTPRRNPDDPRFLQWVMSTGTEEAPQLSQAGADWYFDRTAPRSPVLNISVDGDGTVMGERGFVVGNGTEADALIRWGIDPTLIDAGYPLLEVEENRPTVEVDATLAQYAVALVARSARPVEVWNIDVHARAARDVRAGDYARVVVRGHAYLPDGEHRVRVQKIAGSEGDVVTLTVFPLEVTP